MQFFLLRLSGIFFAASFSIKFVPDGTSELSSTQNICPARVEGTSGSASGKARDFIVSDFYRKHKGEAVIKKPLYLPVSADGAGSHL